ncbi:hypothetical protein RKD39_003015 [Streptomyces albogriseolus]
MRAGRTRSWPGAAEEKSCGDIRFARTSSRRSRTTSSNTDCWSTRSSRAAALYDRKPTSSVTVAVTAANATAKVVPSDSSRIRRRWTDGPCAPPPTATQPSRRT